jgi:hypothetical protein
MYIFGAPVYKTMDIVHSIGLGNIMIQPKNGDSSIVLFDLPDNKKHLLGRPKQETDGSSILALTNGLLISLLFCISYF